MPHRHSIDKERTDMHIAILTFEGFNELDSLIALGILNRIKTPGWRVSIASPTAQVRSMNGLLLESQISLQEANTADAVIVGSGMRTREVVADAALMAQLQLDIEAERKPVIQTVAAPDFRACPSVSPHLKLSCELTPGHSGMHRSPSSGNSWL
jgi:putative intracellular protease/amidase